MAKIEDIVKAEYNLTTEIWRWEHKWLEKIPLSMEDYKAMYDEGNELAKKRKGKSQDCLVGIINAYADEIVYIDKKIKEGN